MSKLRPGLALALASARLSLIYALRRIRIRTELFTYILRSFHAYFFVRFRELVDAYETKGAVPLKILGAAESLWATMSKQVMKTLRRHLKMVGGFEECLCEVV